MVPGGFLGADAGIRTPDLLFTNLDLIIQAGVFVCRLMRTYMVDLQGLVIIVRCSVVL
jgi:hypothetical protein